MDAASQESTRCAWRCTRPAPGWPNREHLDASYFCLKGPEFHKMLYSEFIYFTFRNKNKNGLHLPSLL